MKIPDTPEKFFEIIPTDILSNIKFRIELHKLLSTDKQAQAVFLEMCRQYLPIFFNTTAWTLNPQKNYSERNQPFILRPAQIPAVLDLVDCIHNCQDAGLNKSRKQGASEICCKIFAGLCLLEPRSHFIIGSRKKELVDNYGDDYTLFAKVDNVFDCLPSWWLKLCGYDPKINRKDMVRTIPATSSAIVGETTNESFSAGSRSTAMLLDEFGRVDKSIADSIEGSVHDVTNCVIYSSTHWLGINHTFNKCLKKDTTKVIELMWYDNPEENYGLYRTPQSGQVEILDIDYYKKTYGDIFEGIPEGQILDIDQLPEGIFIADGLKHLPSPYRSPWFDKQERKRKGNRRDLVCNVCATPLGASDAPFDPQMLETIRETSIREPSFEGEVTYQLSLEDGTVDVESIAIYPGGQRRLKWWGEFQFERPCQYHSYVIGIDPSYGLGSANSTACIYDVNLREQVGSWADSSTKPEDMADIIIALAHWIGGSVSPLLIWESNAACGMNFGNRIVFNSYYNVYTQRVEDSKTRKKTKKWGWRSNAKAKENLLGDLGIALSGGLIEDTTYLAISIHEEELLDELADCVFKEGGSGIIQASRADLSTGAAERHGDRAIAAALCILGAKEQLKGNVDFDGASPYGSFKYWLNEDEKKRRKRKREERRYLY